LPGHATAAGRSVAVEALRYVGTPYLWGGDSGRGVDCSGLVYLIFAGYVRGLPRANSYELFRVGSSVERADLAAGDLVFFTTYAPGPSHVGIYLGDGQFVHASPSAGRVVVAELDQAYFVSRYLGARRLLTP
jgi:cell wall-associated NlpC family hydrolase